MKKIFTLAIATMFTAVLFAADRKPLVTLNNSKNYEIVIDGRSYFNSIDAMSLGMTPGGHHTIKVYELRKGRFVKGKRLVDQSSFQVMRSDVVITVDRSGDISIREKRNNNDRFDNNRNKKNDRDFDRGRDNRKF